MKNKITLIFLAAAMLISLFALTACAGNSGDTERKDTGLELVPAQEIGDGRVTFRFEVTDDTGTVKAWIVNTDRSIVGDALLDVGLISGDVSAMGLMVTEVNGLTADYMVNQSWWALYINGEFAVTGVDATDIEQGKVYAFIYTIG